MTRVTEPPARLSSWCLGLQVPLLGLIIVSAVASCGGEPPALEIRPLDAEGEVAVAYSTDELRGLPTGRRAQLGELAAFGLAVAREELDALFEPALEHRRRELLVDLLRAETAFDSLGVSDDVLRARYLTDPAYELTVRHLVIRSERSESEARRDSARAEAAHALERIRAGEDFPAVAGEVSEEPGADERGGLLEPGRRGAWVDEFWNAASALEEGEVSDVVETRYGFHVLRLEERDTVPFTEVRPRVVREVAGMMGVLEDRRRPPASLPPDLQGDEEVSAGVRAAADSARARGLEAPRAALAETRRGLEEAARRWAAALGFRGGMSAEEVRRAALEALGATGQGPTVARNELGEWGPLLRRAYRIRTESSAQ